MCHDWWQWRMWQEREADRELWDEFERTKPIAGPDTAGEHGEIVLEPAEPEPVAAKR
jgi:hypothetical protein